RSLGVIVHNRYAASQMEGVRAPVELIPHHLSPTVFILDAIDKRECRKSLGIPQNTWVIASHGFVTQSKRIPTVLAAFKRLLQIKPNLRYLIVGEDHWKWSVKPLLKEMNLEDHVKILGYVSEPDFFRYLKAADVMVNLRYPTAGETSGTLIRSLGAGKPVIVTDFGQFSELPDDVVLKVPPGPGEEIALFRRLQALIFRPALAESLGKRAAEWVREECAIEKSAARYLEFIEQIIRKKGGRRQAQPVRNYRFEFNDLPAIRFDSQEA